MDLAHMEPGNSCTKKADSLMACRSQIPPGKTPRHRGLEVQGRAGSWLVGGEVGVIDHLFRSSGQL